jgi:hypothetical protein
MQKKRGDDLKGFLLLLVLIGIFCALLVFPVRAQALDLSKPLGLGDEKTFVLDGEFTMGKTFSSSYDVADDIEMVSLTSKQHEWHIQSEIGLKFFDVVRPYWKYTTVTGIYNEDELGVDVMFPVLGLDIGVRGAYIARDDYKIAESEYWFSGVRLRF